MEQIKQILAEQAGSLQSLPCALRARSAQPRKAEHRQNFNGISQEAMAFPHAGNRRSLPNEAFDEPLPQAAKRANKQS